MATASSGFLTAGFADRFDRKKLLLFFYVGFLGGTLLCGLAHTYTFLLLARTVTGVFAIITDLFAFQSSSGVLLHFDMVGYVLVGTTLITLLMMFFISRMVEGDRGPPVVAVDSPLA